MIQIFTTGGTIDKTYFDAKSEYEVGEPQIANVLRVARVSAPYKIDALMRKDSLDLTEEDRALIYQRVAESKASRILITHGTDTLIKTAKLLGKVKNKTIVLTGSLAPARFRESDAVFNIGCAFGAVQTLECGVFITISGCIFDPSSVRKNSEKNTFETVPSGNE